MRREVPRLSEQFHGTVRQGWSNCKPQSLLTAVVYVRVGLYLQSEFFHSTGQQMKNVFVGSGSSSPVEDDESNNSGSSGQNSPLNSDLTI